MTYKDGKFWENGKEVPAQIGNTEQIALLRKAEREIENAETNGIRLYFSGQIKEVTIDCDFDCICGEELSDSETTYGFGDGVDNFDASDYADEFDGNKIKCHKCGRTYKLESGVAKLIKK